MDLTMLKAKIHRATVTETDLHYEGSIAIDAALLKAAGILPHEQVDVLNITNGNRFTTYAIPAPVGSGTVAIKGAAARLAQPGDLAIICAFARMPAQEAQSHEPVVLQLGADNSVQKHPKAA